LPGRRPSGKTDDTNWLPTGTIYQFRALLVSADFETAKQQFLEVQRPPVPAPLPSPTETQPLPAKRMSFEDQLAAISNGAALIEVRPISRRVAEITYGGVCSYDG
jgi:hypothetical protein